jgi:AcrR family transcriptional regulator
MTRRLDPRVRRTRESLREALVALIIEKDYDSITIQNITDRARLRRATFYLHYRDKSELLFTTLRELFDELVEQINALPDPPLSPEYEKAVFKIILRHAEKHANLYRSVTTGPGSALTVRYIREYIFQVSRNRFDELNPPPLRAPFDVVATYLATTKLHMAIWWLENDMPYSIDDMADMCTTLTLKGLHGLVPDETPAPNGKKE